MILRDIMVGVGWSKEQAEEVIDVMEKKGYLYRKGSTPYYLYPTLSIEDMKKQELNKTDE